MTYPINAVIFDIDGVLLDSLFIWKELGRRFIVKHGYTPVPNMDEILFSMSMEQGAAWLKDTFSLENSEEEIIQELETRIQTFYFEEVKAKPGAEALLQRINKLGIPVVAATSSPREHVRKALERNHLLPYLKEIYNDKRDRREQIFSENLSHSGKVSEFQSQWNACCGRFPVCSDYGPRCRFSDSRNFRSFRRTGSGTAEKKGRYLLQVFK